MARSTKPTTKTPRSAKRVPSGKGQDAMAAAALAAAPATKAKPARTVADRADAAPAPGRGKVAVAAPPASTTRTPPPSKGELRAQIEKLEAANATLKAKSREANRAAKTSARRIAELEGQVAQLEEAAANAVDPAIAAEKLDAANAALKAKGREASRAASLAQRRIAELEAQIEQLQAQAAEPVVPPAPAVEQKISRRGRPPGRKKAIDPIDAVPPGVAVEEPEPMDPEAEVAREALEKHLSGQQAQEEE